MKFPITAAIVLRSEDEHAALLGALQSAADNLGSPMAPIVAGIMDSIVYHVGDDRSLPEAYLVIDGVRGVEGTQHDVDRAFSAEVAAHTAPVAMMARDPGTAVYRAIRMRHRVIRFG